MGFLLQVQYIRFKRLRGAFGAFVLVRCRVPLLLPDVNGSVRFAEVLLQVVRCVMVPLHACRACFGAWMLVPLQGVAAMSMAMRSGKCLQCALWNLGAGALAGCRCRVLLGSWRVGACMLVLQGAAARQWPYVSGRVRFGLVQGAAQMFVSCELWSLGAGTDARCRCAV